MKAEPSRDSTRLPKHELIPQLSAPGRVSAGIWVIIGGTDA